jgi:hypothetical protein
MVVFVEFVILNLINIPVYMFMFRKFFTTRERFKESLNFYLKPDLVSLSKGEFWEDKLGELKVVLFFAICIVLIIAEFVMLHKLIALWDL